MERDQMPALTAALAIRLVKLEGEMSRLGALVERLCAKVNVSDAPSKPRSER